MQGSPLLGVAAEPQRDGKWEMWGSNPISWQCSWPLVGLGAPAVQGHGLGGSPADGDRSRASGRSKGWALQRGSSEHLPSLTSISPNEHLPSVFPNGHFSSLHRAVLLRAVAHHRDPLCSPRVWLQAALRGHRYGSHPLRALPVQGQRCRFPALMQNPAGAERLFSLPFPHPAIRAPQMARGRCARGKGYLGFARGRVG